MNKPINCWYLDHAYDTQENGPCCFQKIKGVASYTEFHASSAYHEIKSHFEKGQWPDNYCRRCSDVEKQFGGELQSKRQSALPLYDHYNVSMDVEPKHLHSLTVDAGRYCNIQCRICNPYCSSSWITESLTLQKQHPAMAKWIIHPMSFSESSKVYQSVPFDFGDDLSELRHVHFTGGEPLYSADLNPILLHILEKAGDQCLISIMTNGTLSYKSVPALTKFSNVSIVLSLDGIGKTAEFVRTGCNWEVVDQNIREYVELGKRLSYHPTYGVLNIFGAVELAEYANKMGMILSLEKGFVDHVPYLSFSVLNDREKVIVLDYLYKNNLMSIAERVQSSVYDPVDRQNFFDFMDHTYKFHGMFWGDYLPELYALLNPKM